MVYLYILLRRNICPLWWKRFFYILKLFVLIITLYKLFRHSIHIIYNHSLMHHWKSWLSILFRVRIFNLHKFVICTEFYHFARLCILTKKFPGGSDGKESSCNAGDLGSIPGLGGYLGERNSYPLQYSCLENSMERGAWWSIVHGVTKSQAWLSDLTLSLWISWSL